jgi:AraC-like DNA-binding protein
LLLETTQPIGEIAVHAGFGTHDYFVQFFRRRVGVSPRKFRDARGA